MQQDAHELATRWGVPLIFAVVAVVVRTIATGQRLSRWGLARGILLGLFVGATVNGWMLDQVAIGDSARGAVSGVAAVLAEDIVVALLVLGRRARRDPLRALNDLRGPKL